MKIIEPQFKIISPANDAAAINALQFIELAARISHRSEDAQTPDSWRRFLNAVVIGHGDYSVIEHASASVLFRVDRGITHELVRHRLFSYTQESTRFVNGRKSYPDGLQFIEPIDLPAGFPAVRFHSSCSAAEEAYLSLLDAKVRPQEARAVLPNALASTIAMTGNFRSWRHFFLMRTTRESHPDMRRVAVPLLAAFKERIPLLYDDVEPDARQIDNLKKAK